MLGTSVHVLFGDELTPPAAGTSCTHVAMPETTRFAIAVFASRPMSTRLLRWGKPGARKKGGSGAAVGQRGSAAFLTTDGLGAATVVRRQTSLLQADLAAHS